MPVSDQLLRRLVPETKVNRAKTRPKCHRRNGGKQFARGVTALEVVVRDAWAEVMDVVESDVA